MKKQRSLGNKRNDALISYPYLWMHIDRFLIEKRWKQILRGDDASVSPTYLKREEVWSYAMGFSNENIEVKLVNLGD